MNRVCVVIAVLIATLFSHWAGAEMREFKTPDGKTVKAEIISFNAKLGKVELKREGGKHVKVKPEIFVEADQTYIKEWSSLDAFRNTSFFKVDCNKNIVEKWKEDGNIFEVRHERVEYEVHFENRSATPIENLTAEYCIFYEQEKSRPGEKKSNLKLSELGKLDIDRLSAKEKRTLNTESVVLSRYDFNSTDYYYDQGNPESARGTIKGIWLRLTVTTPSGQLAVREAFSPASLEGKYSWPKHTESKKKKRKKKKN